MLTAANHLLQLMGLVDTNMKTKDKPLTADGMVLTCLTEAYFRRLKAEKLGSTPRLTEELNILEDAIKYMKSKQNNETSPS